MIKAVIFDYDGVLVDSFHTVHEIYQEICKTLGVPCPSSLEEFKRIYGYHAGECRRNLGVKPEDFQQFNDSFGKKVLEKNPEPFDSIKEVLEKLSASYQLFVVTANTTEEATQKLKKFGLAKYFIEINGGDGMIKRPKQKFIPILLEKYKLGPDNVVYIGDRNIDYDLGMELGIKNTFLVDYGWGYDKDAVKQEISIKKPSDILKVIRSIS